MVGLGGLEPPTSPLSGARSSHLSYRPTLRLVQTIMLQLFAIIKFGSIWDYQLAIAPNLATTSFRCLALKCVYLLFIFKEVWSTHFVSTSLQPAAVYSHALKASLLRLQSIVQRRYNKLPLAVS